MAKAKIPSEHQEQAWTVAYFKLQWPRLAEAIFSNPNGMHVSGESTKGHCSAKVKAIKINKLKKEGFKPGVSDLQIAVPRGCYHGLWVEMKRANGTVADVSDDQMKHILLMRCLGYKAEWAAGYLSAKNIIDEYMRLK